MVLTSGNILLYFVFSLLYLFMEVELDTSKETFDFWWMIWKYYSQQSFLSCHVFSTACLIRLGQMFLVFSYGSFD